MLRQVRGEALPPILLSLAGIDGLADVAVVDEDLVIGAMTRLVALERSALVADQAPGLIGAHGHHNFAACVVELSVDTETGALDIHDVLVVVDVGTIINPVSHRGQIVGGLVFGLGQSTMEELVIADGRIETRNLDAYRLPRTIDIPPIRVIELPTRIGPGAFGAKMAGELTNAVVGPAIANAIADATGSRLHELPLTASRIRAALRAST